MSNYISTLPLAQPLDVDGARRLALNACLGLHRVDWYRACIDVDGTRMLCAYRAADAESVRLVLRQLGASGPVWPVAVTEMTRPRRQGGSRACVVVEFGTQISPLDARDADALPDAATGALEAAGHAVVRIYAVKARPQLVVVVDGTDDAAVIACLRGAGLSPDSVWQATEVDPRPPPLFAAAAPEPPTDIPVRATSTRRSVPTDTLDAVIIGAGLGGICALERLLRMGLRVRAYEAGRDVGGVWHWNRYPGARIDSESYTYGYSFSDALVRDWNWHELFAPQPEIERYFQHVVDRFDLRRHIRLETRVSSAAYDAADGRWSVTTDRGERVRARFLIAAAGSLSAPQLPDYPGIDTFGGEHYHTARWPQTPVALAGKHVGVIGTGATGVQVIQTIASEVASLTVFQRTPTFCVPQRNRKLADDDRDAIRRDWAQILATCQGSYGGFIHDFEARSGLGLSAAEREAKFEALWQTPGHAFWLGNYGDLAMNEEVNAHASDFLRRKIRARVQDPVIADKLMPTHPFGSRRVPLENGYYETFNRANVRLVDLRETPIVEFTRSGIRTSIEEIPLDVVVFATGFDAGTGSLTRIDLRGESGQSIADKWREGPTTYLGMLVSGFPNFFMVNGPHNGAALCNAGRCIEQNVDWIARCLEHMRSRALTRIAPTEAAEAEWTRHVEDLAEATLVAKSRDSWFYGANTPGKARRVNVYVGGARAHKQVCEGVAQAGYPGLSLA